MAQNIACNCSAQERSCVKSLLLPTCSNYIRELFARTQTFNGARWLMIRVSEAQVLEDVKKLIRLRVVPKE